MKQHRNTRGKISEKFLGLGTADRALLEQRARDIAEINGRPSDQYNEHDLEQASRELWGVKNVPSAGEEEDETVSTTRLGIPGTAGHRAETRPATDEQTVAEDLVQEGVDEATHEQMLEGSRESLERSKK
jgi:hypothetical protein